VNLEGGWHYGRPGVDLIADDWMDYGSVAVRLSWTLWDWGVRRRQIQSVRAREMSIRERRSDLENDFLTRRAIAASHLEAASAGQDKAAERVELENRRLELTRQRVHDGHASASALLDSQDDLTLAEVELAASRARLRLAEVELLDAMGY
jgi:outer membrane protein